MASFNSSKKGRFWKKCFRKLTEMSDQNCYQSVRHHSIRRWKNAPEQPVIKKATAFNDWAALTPKLQPEHITLASDSNSRPKRKVSGAATAPVSSHNYSKESLSPQTYTTAETFMPNNDLEQRPTLDPRRNGSFRSSIKFNRFNTTDNLEPSFRLGIMSDNVSETSASVCSQSKDEDDTQTTLDSGTFDSRSFESLINSFDWYASNVFKRLETSVLSFLNHKETAEEKSSAISSTISPFFSETLDSVLTPCTGAATKWDHAIDEAIYGQHAKCFI